MLLSRLFISALVLWITNANAEIDELKMGKSKGYPVCDEFPYTDLCKVGSFSTPAIFKHSVVTPSKNMTPLETIEKGQLMKLGNFNIEEYLSKQRATGLMILKDGKIFTEKYQYGRDSETPFRSFSMSKTITSLLFGIALEKGYIDSIEDKTEKYLPELQGTVFGDAKLKNLLRMSVGSNFEEDYSFGKSDIKRFYNNMHYKGLKSNALEFNQKTFTQGEKFKYSTSDTIVLSRVLTRATRKTITQLTQEWLWEPIGAENKAYWILLKSDNLEDAGGGFFATLKDYAKIGALLANDGFWNNIQIVPKQYILDATDSKLQPEGFKNYQASYNYFGYGYQVWLMPFPERTFSLQGIYGQVIFVQPSSKVVMIQTSAYERPAGDPSWTMQLELFREALKYFNGAAF